MANKFQLKTVMELAKCDETEANTIVDVIDSQNLVDSWSNGTNRDFKIAITFARAYIKNGNSWGEGN